MITARGFALPIVFLVLLLLGVAFLGVSDTLVTAAHTSSRRAVSQEKYYACEGIIRLAQGVLLDMTLDDPDMDFVDLEAALAPVRAVALEHGIDLSAPRPAPVVEDTVFLDEGGLKGLEVLTSAAQFGLSGPPSANCDFNIAQPLGKISPLQFVAFSVDGGAIENGTNVGVVADPSFTWGRARIGMPGGIDPRIEATDEANAPVRLPIAAEGEPRGLERSRTFRPYLQKPFTNNDEREPERASLRFAYQADLRIVDGEWYLRDPADPLAWPGIALFGDHPCDAYNDPAPTCGAVYETRLSPPGEFKGIVPGVGNARRRLYSAYERNEDGIVVHPGQPPRGVVSYGRLFGNEPGVSTSGICPGAGSPPPGTLRPISQCMTGGADVKLAVVNGAREAFADPKSGAAVLPINIDVGLLGQALFTTAPVNDELGAHVCNPTALGCLRPFNGMVYVTSTQGADPTLAPGPYPYALCGGGGGGDQSVDKGAAGGVVQPCDSAVRYNAVRLHNAANLAAFAATGLTIATDLPVYVAGDWNRGFQAGPRTLVMGDRVTLLTSGFRDDGGGGGGGGGPGGGGPGGGGPASVDFLGSVLAGWPAGGGFGAGRNFSALLRVVEGNVNVRVTGALVGGFTSTTVGGGDPGKITRWDHPFDLARPLNELQPPGVPRVALGLPPELTSEPGTAGF